MESETDKKTESDERYGAIETGDGETVIYDRQHNTAWLQSDTTVDVST